MKKVVLLVLSLVLAMACVVSSFAYAGIATFDEEECKGKLEGKTLNSGDAAELSSGILKIRRAWTASRAMPDDTARFVKLGEDNIGVKITNTEYITNDPDSNPRLEGKAYVTADLKVVNAGTFCGIVIDCDQEAGFNSSGNNVFEATHDKYILYSGYGFTIKDKNTIVAFVNASATGTVDYVEIALGFDASAALHTYAIYRDADAKKSYLCADDACIAVFDFSKDADHVGIYSADGATMIVNTNNNWKDGNIWFAVVGASEVYLDNIGYDAYENVPAPKAEDPETPAGPYAGFVNASFDYIDTYADAEAKTKLQANVGYEKSAGFGSDALDAIQRTIKSEDGSIKAIKVQGWAGFDQEIEEYGYRINGVDTIVAGSKFDSAADKSAVQDATKGGGQYAHRYGMTIPVGDLKGENKIVVIAKLADGTIVEINGDFNDKLHEYSQTANTSFTFVGPKASEPQPQKPTGDVAIVLAVVAVAAMAVVVLKKRETI